MKLKFFAGAVFLAVAGSAFAGCGYSGAEINREEINAAARDYDKQYTFAGASGALWRRPEGQEGFEEDSITPDTIQKLAKLVEECRADPTCRGVFIAGLAMRRNSNLDQGETKWKP